MFSTLACLFTSVAASGLTGHYYGAKDVMFNDIKVNIDSDAGEPGFFSLTVAGIPGGNEVDCPKEAYTMKGTALSMPNLDKAGDCAHDQFKKADLEFLGAVYDAEADTITVMTKYMFIHVTIVCKKTSAVVHEALAPLSAVAASSLTGHYYGAKDVMFNDIKVNIDSDAGEPGFFSLTVSGIPGGNEVDCPKEAYTMSGTALSMPNLDKAGDCAHDQFKKADLEFLGAVYDAEADTITVMTKYMFIHVTIVCKKTSAVVHEALAPLEKMLESIVFN